MIKVSVGNITRYEEDIVDEGMTLRQLFEKHGVNYAAGSPMLDGATLQPGDLDKTFAQMGVRSKCFLLVAMKQSNAAKVLVLGSTAVVRSSLKIDTIKEMEKYSPNKLVIYDYDTSADKMVPKFRVGVAESGQGSLNEFGASFSSSGSADGEGVITIQIPDNITDKPKYVRETYGKALVDLNEAEEEIERSYNDIAEKINKIDGMIEVL